MQECLQDELELSSLLAKVVDTSSSSPTVKIFRLQADSKPVSISKTLIKQGLARKTEGSVAGSVKSLDLDVVIESEVVLVEEKTCSSAETALKDLSSDDKGDHSSEAAAGNVSGDPAAAPGEQLSTEGDIAADAINESNTTIDTSTEEESAETKEKAVVKNVVEIRPCRKEKDVDQSTDPGDNETVDVTIRMCEMEDLSDVEVKILNVEHPHQLWLRRLEDQNFFDNMQTIIQRHFIQKPNPGKPSRVKAGCYYLCWFEGSYYRARVKVVASSTVAVFLVDLGRSTSVSSDQLCCLPVELSRWPCLTFSFRLHGVEKESESTWTNPAAQLLLTYGSGSKVFLRRVKKFAFDGDFFGDIEFVNVTSVDPLLGPTEDRMLASEFLVRNGLARKTGTPKKKPGLSQERQDRSSSGGLLTPPTSPTFSAPEAVTVNARFALDPGPQFSGIITGIDKNGIVWVLPEDQFVSGDLVNNLTELEPVPDTAEIRRGDVLAHRTKGRPYRVLVFRVLAQDIYQVLRIDEDGAEVTASRQELLLLPASARQIPVITFPVQLYGVRKTGNIESRTERGPI